MKLKQLNKVFMIILFSLLYILCLIFWIIKIDNQMLVFFVSILLIISLIIIVFKYIKKRLFSFLGIYTIYFSLTHFGQIFIETFFPNANRTVFLNPFWLTMRQSQSAVLLSSIFLGSILIIYLKTMFTKKNINSTNEFSIERKNNKLIYYFGITFILLSGVYLLGLLFSGIIRISSSYLEYRSLLSDQPLAYFLFLFIFSSGLILTFSSGTKRQILYSTVLFAIPAGILLITGNRGEVFFPVAASIAVYYHRGFRLKRLYVIIGVFLIVFIIPFIQQFRNYDWEDFNIDEIDINMSDSIYEMGVTIRPFIFTIEWIDNGEDFAYGRTYYLPITHIFGSRLIPGFDAGYQNSRFDLNSRLPSQGYSVVSEAYFNFGIIGIFLIAFILGKLLFYMDNKTSNTLSIAINGILFSTLINNIRNVSDFVFLHLILLILLVIIIKSISKIDR